MPYPELRDRAVLVTGAGQGLGRAYAQRFADEGARVAVADVQADKGEAVAEELRAGGARALFVHADVADADSCRAMARAVVDAFGRVDVLVNNAAIFATIAMKPFWEIAPEEWDRLMAVNLRGVWLAATAVVQASMREHGGVIVNVSSGVVHIGRRDYAHYVASKGGVMALSRSMARELGEFGVRVNSITPGPVYTEVPRDTVTPEQKRAIADAQCIKRPAEPADLTGVVAFLASDDARFISGQTINVDGGLTTY